MPTHDAHFRLRECGGGIRVADDDGGLRPGVHEVLEIIAANDMTLASGHISPSEAIALFAVAKAQGVQRIIATHSDGVATPEEQRRMMELGAYPEYTFLSCMPSRARRTPQQIAETIRSLGIANCIVTTELGQWQNPPPAEGMRMAIAALLDAGMTPDEVTTLVKTNPTQLVS